MNDLEKRIQTIDEDVSSLTKTVDYIEVMIMNLLKEKNDCIHDLKVEKQHQEVWFKTSKKPIKKVVDHTQDPNNTYGLIM